MDIRWAGALAATLALAGPAQARPGFTKGVANADLVAAAKATPLRLIDYGEALCRNDRTVAAWLTQLTGAAARAIAWTGGPCQLVHEGGIDSGSDWCAQATISLRHPEGRDDAPMIEIFFDRPVHGRPSPAYAFRATLGEEGMIRFRRDFESAWRERFPQTPPAVCSDDD